MTVAVTDVNEPPAFTSATAAFDVPENTTAVGSAAAADPDAADTTVTYALAGTDADLFSIDADGAIAFDTAPNFESPGCGAGNDSNTCTVTVTATAGDSGAGREMSTLVRTVTVTVTDANEPPAFDTSALTLDTDGTALFTVAENTTEAVGTVTAADPDAADDTVTWSLGGTDAALFSIGSDGAITFDNPPNFEDPKGGADDDSNDYAFTVTASTGGTGRAMTATLDAKDDGDRRARRGPRPARAADGGRDLGVPHQPRGALDRAGQRRPAHHELRRAVPPRLEHVRATTGRTTPTPARARRPPSATSRRTRNTRCGCWRGTRTATAPGRTPARARPAGPR